METRPDIRDVVKTAVPTPNRLDICGSAIFSICSRGLTNLSMVRFFCIYRLFNYTYAVSTVCSTTHMSLHGARKRAFCVFPFLIQA